MASIAKAGARRQSPFLSLASFHNSDFLFCQAAELIITLLRLPKRAKQNFSSPLFPPCSIYHILRAKAHAR